MAKQAAPTATASRLPSTRESRPALIGLAVLLIVGGALASAYLAIQSGNRSYFLQVTQEVAQGSEITADDVRRVSLPEEFEGGIPADDQDSVVGEAASVRLLPGTVLNRDMISETGGLPAGQTQLAVPVDDSSFVRGLPAGSQLALSIGGDDGQSAVLAELQSVGSGEDGGIAGGGSSTVPVVVNVDISCLSLVAQGVDDRSVTVSRVGDVEGTDVQKTCGA